MRIMGIDPGTRKTGFGILRYQHNRHQHVHSGVIRLDENLVLEHRLCVLSQELDHLIKEYQPDCVAVEKIFFAKNAQSALVLGHARGVVLLKFTEHEIPLFEYSPLEVKQTVVGVGRAEKQQVQHMVKVLLNQNSRQMKEDESDALAVAITHAHLMKSRK